MRTLRWSAFRGLETPREHLGVTALGGKVYAVGGRTAGLETNTHAAEAYDTVTRTWSTLPDAPTRRGGNGCQRRSNSTQAVSVASPEPNEAPKPPTT